MVCQQCLRASSGGELPDVRPGSTRAHGKTGAQADIKPQAADILIEPYAGRFGEFGQRVDLAAERAAAALASRRGRIGRNDHGG